MILVVALEVVGMVVVSCGTRWRWRCLAVMVEVVGTGSWLAVVVADYVSYTVMW